MNTDEQTSEDRLVARLVRIEGQVRGVARMVREERDCIDVLTQIEAIQGALDRVSLGLLDGHARVCMHANAPRRATEADVDELMHAVARALGH